MNKIKRYFINFYKWYIFNTQKIIFVIGLHFISLYIVDLPYINIFTSLFSFLPYFFDWIAILILFRPKKELFLKTGLLLFIIGFLFTVIKLSFMSETIGQISYLMIVTYVILILKEVKNN